MTAFRARIELGCDAATAFLYLVDYLQPQEPGRQNNNLPSDVLAMSDYLCGLEFVVDPQFRVRGIDRLRICDGTVMPTLAHSDTIAATIMIGEKGV